MTDQIDIDAFRLHQSSVGTAGKQRLPHHKPGEYFLRGPIPWPWLKRAARQPGKVLHLGTHLWFQAGMKKTSAIAINLTRVSQEFGFDRATAARALATMEQVGLVAVKRGRGKKSIVTILEVHD